jgi:serine/threonine-protein kinase
MGAVYRARDFRLGRDVAVKLLLEGDPGSRSGLLQEARSQARLRHPRVCEVFEAGVADSVPFIVMRYVDGAPLHKAQQAMTTEEKVRVVREIALALHEAHRLGMVHRDVKPGNVLVERGEDGAYTPYIADFGLARDVTEGGALKAHSVQGTPAYMAPEQAAGRGGSLDRRTDVYGLGATLYAALAGQPPFPASDVTAILKMVEQAPAPPLRTVAPSTPADLEAITMKCLEKDPAQRYPSAKALGEDLQRFLDGDPVEARPRAWGVRLWKRARKNKGKVAAASVAGAAALVLSGFWIRSLRIAGEREALAREMGGAVREMELFLRAAHTLPLHDVEVERDVLRARLAEIAARTGERGEIGVGPGEDALGRGSLALQDAAAAMEHFRRAEAAGYRAPGLDYAVGLALIELYRQALERTSRIQKESDKRAYIAQIESQYKAPALARLRAALAQGVESPAYALGLVALYEGRHEEALSRAREAYRAAPWLYEAKKLEGDVLFAMGSRTGHDKEFDYERASRHFEEAAAAYHAAADVARSDPAVHEAECSLWIQVMNAAAEHGDSMRPAFDHARRACERAIAASPRSPSGTLKLAWAHNCFAFWVATAMRTEESPERALAAAAERVEEAEKRSPEDAFASYLGGAVWRSRALYLFQLGRDAGPAIDRAIAGYEKALTLDPAFLWALNEECSTLSMRGRWQGWRGIDPRPSFEQALSRCGRALALDPDFMFPRAGTIEAHLFDADRLLGAGLSPHPAVEEGLAATALAEKQYPTWQWIPFFRAELLRAEAEHALATGEDPGPALARAEPSVAALAAAGESFPDAAAPVGEIATVTAEAQLARIESGAAPREANPALEAALARARGAFTGALGRTPWDIGYAVWLARAGLVELRYRLALGRASHAHGDAALAPLAPFLAEPKDDPRLYEMAARVHEARAALRAKLGEDPAEEIAAAVALARQAIAVGPGLASARAVLERLRLSPAPLTREGTRSSSAGRGR